MQSARSLPKLLIGATALSLTILARPTYADQCSGWLTAERGELTIITGRESICVVGKSDEHKVLSSCAVGQQCVVTGSVDLCKDGVECVEVSRVTRAHR
jgi:hypothetical protein